MNTNEKLDKKIKKFEAKLIEKLQCVKDFDDEKEIKSFSENLNIDKNTVQNLFSQIRVYKKNKKDYQMLAYISKNSTSGVNLYNDVTKAKEKVKSSEKEYKKFLDTAKFEMLIKEIPDSKVSKGVIEYLKENDVDKNVIISALDKYAAEVELDSNNSESILSFLYENGYVPVNNNSVDIAYKYYSESKKKDEDINKLEHEMFELEDVIHRNINTIKALNLKLGYYEQTVPNMQATIKECVEKAKSSAFNVKSLQKQAEIKEHTGIFKRMFSKIKYAFKKDKPLLLSASLDGIHSDMSAVSNGLIEVENSIILPESKESILKSIQRQKNIAFGVKNMMEPIESR